MLQTPSGPPHPDGVQRITNASNELSVARKEMVRAYARLTDYVERGIVPEDLKAKARRLPLKVGVPDDLKRRRVTAC